MELFFILFIYSNRVRIIRIIRTKIKKTITLLLSERLSSFFIFYHNGFIFFKAYKLKIICIVNKERLYLGKIKKIENKPILAK